jgi:hypothetical protein
MNRVLLINGSAPWAFNRSISTSPLPLSLFTPPKPNPASPFFANPTAIALCLLTQTIAAVEASVFGMDGFEVCRLALLLRIKFCTNGQRTSIPVRTSCCALLSAAEFFRAMIYAAMIWVQALALHCICESGRLHALSSNCTITSDPQ